MRLFSLLASFGILLGVLGCSSTPPDPTALVLNSLKSEGKVLKETKRGNETFLVMEEGPKITKYRVYKTGGNAYFKVVYMNDTATGVCYRGTIKAHPIDCHDLKTDPDMGSFVRP